MYIELKKALHIVDIVTADKGIRRKCKAIRKRLKELPGEDVVEVKHGEWINEGEYLYKCSLCGDKAFLRLGGKPCRYCPNCGAKMDGKEGAEEC